MNDRLDELQPPPSEGLSIGEPKSADSNILTAYGRLDETKAQTEFCFPDGKILRVPTSFLLDAAVKLDTYPATDIPSEIVSVVPVLQERLEVGKRTIETGKVRLEKHVDEYQETLDEQLLVRTFDIERVSLQQVVDAPPPVRQEGDTTVYPIVEERLVLTKELVLREELRVTRRETERRDTRVVSLKRESVTVTRTEVDE